MGPFDQQRVAPRRRLLAIRDGVLLAAVMTFAVVLTAVVLWYGQPAATPDNPSGVSIPGGSPLLEPLPAPPPAAATSATTPSPSPSAAASSHSVTPSPGRGSVGPTPSAAFVPIAIQAESPGNTRTGGAKAISCDTCAGGARVGYVGGADQLSINLSLPAAGRRTLVVTYESDGPRTLEISANGTVIARQRLTGVGWETPMTYQIIVTLPAGPLRLGFFNNDGPAPDIDLVVVH